MDENVQHSVLKKLAFEYKDACGEERDLIFCKILRRIDNLVLFVARKFLPRTQYEDADLEEIYGTAIVGLYKGLEKVREKETGAKLQARLIAYMKSELKQTFCSRIIKKKVLQNIIDISPTVIPEETVYRELESEFLRERYQKLVADEVISSEELGLLTMRYVHGVRIKEIAKRVNHTPWWVGKKIPAILNKIRYELRRRDLEDV